MAKIVFVSSNIGGTKVVIPAAQLAEEQGHEIVVCAGGRGLKLWKDSGMPISVLGKDALIARPDGFDPYAFPETWKPDLIFAGQSSPMDWESDILLAALSLGIKTFSIGDFWNGWTRLNVGPLHMVGVLDNFDVQSYQQGINYQSPRNSVPVITGNPGAVKVAVPNEIQVQFDQLRKKHGRVYLYVMGGPESALAELELVVKSLLLTPKGVLVPRGNPKYDKPGLNDADRAFKTKWDEILLRLGDRVAHVASPTGEPLAAAADVTLSGYSTLSTVAVFNGRAVVALRTPETLSSLNRQVGLKTIPHEGMLWAQGLRSPGDLSDVRPTSETYLSRLMPYDAQVALDAALSLLD